MKSLEIVAQRTVSIFCPLFCWLHGCIDGCIDGWVDGWVDGWMDGHISVAFPALRRVMLRVQFSHDRPPALFCGSSCGAWFGVGSYTCVVAIVCRFFVLEVS